MVGSQAKNRAESDRCPYRRPFSEDFAECQSYERTRFTAFDSQGHRLSTWLTCAHLVSGDHPGQHGRFYPRCGLGGPDDRLRWLEMVSRGRLHVIQKLQHEFDRFIQPHWEQLVEAKVLLLTSPPTAELRDNLGRRLSAYREAVRGFLLDAKTRLADVGVSAEDLLTRAEQGAQKWADSDTLQDLDDDHGLPRFARHVLAAATSSGSTTLSPS